MKNRTQAMDSASEFSNYLRQVRAQKGFSQGDLASRAGVTRQAISAIESNLYLPTTAVALRLAAVLDCRVEDLFTLSEGNVIEGHLVGTAPSPEMTSSVRVKVSMIGKKTVVRPVSGLGDVLSFAVPADGFLVRGASRTGGTVRVRLSRDRRAIEQEISVAGCDPSIFLAGEHLRRHQDLTSVVGWSMGSMAALRALQHGEVHVAGAHLSDPSSGESNLPFLRRVLKGSGYDVVTFATWEEGFLVRPGNPKSIRTAADLEEPTVRVVNR